MQNMEKNVNSNIRNRDEVPKQKERHIVSWSPEEDDILREQIHLHGTDNWTIIASNFKDKTTRQCRRRWYTYLNSDFKRGGWSPEEDMLLCEAQKIFGNRWTEIAKVVSGRTDNAVKNRFSTLCKKRAKHEALAKENSNSFINLNNKRVIFPNGLNLDGVSECVTPLKRMRTEISGTSVTHSNAEKSIGEYVRIDQLLRTPFAVLAENFLTEAKNAMIQQQDHSKSGVVTNAATRKIQGAFLKKDDPRIPALMEQAELLSSLALKVNSEDTDQSLENAWQVLQDYLNQTKDSDPTKVTNPYQSCEPVNFKRLIEDLTSVKEGSQPSLRQPDLHVPSPSSSDYSTGSTVLSQAECENSGNGQAALCALTNQDVEADLQSIPVGCQNGSERILEMSCGATTDKAGVFPATRSVQANDIVLCENTDMEFSSPIQVTPLFRSLAAAVPTPNFSESERHFLLKTLGLESTSPNPSANPTHPPLCKRVLLHSL